MTSKYGWANGVKVDGLGHTGGRDKLYDKTARIKVPKVATHNVTVYWRPVEEVPRSQHFIFYARPVPVVVEPLHVQVLGEINTRGTFQPHGVTVLTNIGTLSKTDARHLLALINDGLVRQTSKTRAATLDMMDIER
jgi:hypothetical protein